MPTHKHTETPSSVKIAPGTACRVQGAPAVVTRVMAGPDPETWLVEIAVPLLARRRVVLVQRDEKGELVW